MNHKCNTFGTEIITVTVVDGYACAYIEFEKELTRILNRKYPEYHRGADIFQSTSDSNTFIIVALYLTSVSGAAELDAELEAYVAAHYAACFPYVVSRSVTTDQDENVLVDHCFQSC